MFAHVLGHQTRVEIVGAAGAGASYHRNGLALVEMALGPRRTGRKQQKQQTKNLFHTAPHIHGRAQCAPKTPTAWSLNMRRTTLSSFLRLRCNTRKIIRSARKTWRSGSPPSRARLTTNIATSASAPAMTSPSAIV